ncbi:MAG TPA: outer membrane lipoprotein carrier protein LolA [Alphaproteobacteria bacterium]|nr:outer membrane lipoprotein carrier protein LolA [Alphaproteobacteria bacterium]
MARLGMFFSVLVLALTIPVIALAAQPVEVQKAEAYFAGLKTAEARFIQTSANGVQQRGKFYLSRPGKLRFEYDPPNKDFVVADGLFIYFYDGQMKQQSNAPISQTLADFLLRKNLNLGKDLKVTKIMRGGNLVQIFVVQREDPAAGTLVLGFDEDKDGNFGLRKWRIIDALGNITETELFEIHTGVKFKNSASLFSYRDPEPKGYNR